MAFDPTTAQPVKFDPSTAKPVAATADFGSPEERSQPPPPTDDGLPWDVPLTGDQMRRGEALTKRADAALPFSSMEPSEPGGKHLLWSILTGLPRGAVEIGQAATGARPLPKGAEALGMASMGAVPPPVARGLGSALSHAVPPGRGQRPVPEGYMSYDEASKIAGNVGRELKAEGMIEKRANQDAPTTAQQVIDTLTRGREAGKPMMLPDVLQGNVQSLAGRVARVPGESKEIMTSALRGRNAGAVTRLSEDIDKALGTGATQQLFDDLKTARSQAAKPLFDKANAGGSIAPLEHQFEAAFGEASQAEAAATRALQDARNQVTVASGKQTQTGGNVYSTSAANQSAREAEAAVTAAERDLAKAQTQKQQVLDLLRQAQEDRTLGTPGAVWNPRIQEFLNDSDVQAGIRRGWRIEQNEALAEGRPVNASEYAITGFNDAGEPIVGKVPTMKLLAVAKEGMDAMLQSSSYRNELTGALNKEGVSIDKKLRAFVSELDKVNPDYRAAREQWAGDTKSMQALKYGQELLKEHPESIARQIAEMTEGEREFTKIGLAQALRDVANKRGPLAAEFDRVAGTQYGAQWTRDQLKPLFADEATLQRFVDSVTAETTMARTGNKILGGSQTAERLAEDGSPVSGTDIAHAGVAAARGHLGQLVDRGITMGGKVMDRINPPPNTEIARILADPNVKLMLGPDGKLRIARPPPPGSFPIPGPSP